MNDTPVQLHNTHTQVYRRTDGQEAIQFATRTGGGWLTTSGLLADRLALARQHRNQLLGSHRLTPRLPDLPPHPDIAPGPAAEVDFDDGPALEGWLPGPNKVGQRRPGDNVDGLVVVASVVKPDRYARLVLGVPDNYLRHGDLLCRVDDATARLNELADQFLQAGRQRQRLPFMASFEAFQSHLLRLSWVSGNTPEEGQVGDLYRQLHGAIYGESSHGRDG